MPPRSSSARMRETATSRPGYERGWVWRPTADLIAGEEPGGALVARRPADRLLLGDGDNELWVMNADGSNEHSLLRWPDTGEAADTWLPQGIVFASFVPDAPVPSWFIVEPDGTHLR